MILIKFKTHLAWFSLFELVLFVLLVGLRIFFGKENRSSGTGGSQWLLRRVVYIPN
jgi:hypothetical protein